MHQQFYITFTVTLGVYDKSSNLFRKCQNVFLLSSCLKPIVSCCPFFLSKVSFSIVEFDCAGRKAELFCWSNTVSLLWDNKEVFLYALAEGCALRAVSKSISEAAGVMDTSAESCCCCSYYMELLKIMQDRTTFYELVWAQWSQNAFRLEVCWTS